MGLVHRLSPFPSLRSSKLEGQANFVNPGVLFWTVGVDAELNDIDGEIGWEANVGLIYRPKLTNNIQVASGLAVFFPGGGFTDIYESDDELFSAFVQLTLVY